tara:strand:+ start:903 stop:1139 length:237 start_codon:yes stop_codon:yes gene_type:complete
MPILAFFLGPLGRWVGIVGVAAMVVAGVYGKGRVDGRASYKAKIERQIKDAVEKGNGARDNSLRELDAGRVPNDWLRD